MNGKSIKEIQEIFNAIVLPHIENIKDDVKDIKKQVDEVSKCVVSNKVKIEGNKKDIQNMKNNFRNYVLLVGLIFTGITLLIKLFWK